MKVDAVIQARMGSTRLPGKVLMPLGSAPVLDHVVARCKRSDALREVVVATTTLAEDDAIAQRSERLGVRVVRGSSDDVLSRYAAAVDALRPDAIVRVTSDCPLIDPHVIDDMVARFRTLAEPPSRCDYLSNSLQRTFPRGLDAEVVAGAALLQAAREATAPEEREHVTPFIYRRPERYAIHHWHSPVEAAEHRWTLDTQEDYELLSLIFEALGDAADTAPWRDVLAIVQEHPGWMQINRGVVQKTLPTTTR
jgi:spore coat polysaccharide biosynthesis protein SpsF